MSKALLLICFVTASGAAVIRAQSPAASPRPAEQSGKALYERFGCYQCHGYAGQGSILSGPALVKRKLTAEFVQKYVRSPYGVMPGYSRNVLPDASLRAIAKYVAEMGSGRPAAQIAPLARFKRAE